MSPFPRKLVEAFKHKADEFAGSFKDDLKASATLPLGEATTLAPKAALRISCRKLALTISSWFGAGATMTLDLPLNVNDRKMLKTAAQTGN